MDLHQSLKWERDRQEWIGLLNTADPKDLEAAFQKLDPPIDYTPVVPAETGMLMAQAKTNGSGSRFNLGEITVSRCVLKVANAFFGSGWVLGTHLRHAELAALFDGLLQMPEHHDSLVRTLITPLREKAENQKREMAADIEKTRVSFSPLSSKETERQP